MPSPAACVLSHQCCRLTDAHLERRFDGRDLRRGHNDGIVGVSLFLGGTSTPGYGSVLIAGQGCRIGAQRIREAFDRADSTRRVLLRYTQTLVAQIAQTVLCNRYHTVEQRLCGWLLHRLDRLSDNDVAVTQELIATMLGVRRESVTEAAGRLQAAGLIHHSRGHVMVLDRGGLERRSWECHAVVKQEYDRLLPPDVVARSDLPRRSAWPATGPGAVAHRKLQSQVAVTNQT